MSNKPDLPYQAPCAEPPSGPADWIQGFTIGDRVRVEQPFALAPMSGVTDTAFRCMVQSASQGGVGLFVTEFISIEGLTSHNMLART